MADTPNPPRENLVRALSAAPELVRDDTGGMPVMRGHFAVWNTPTEIRSAYEGHFIEKFAPGSMTKTLAEARDRIKVLFQHGKDPQIADKPLGSIQRLEPDSTGAYYEVGLLDTAYNRELIPGLENNLYGASFRFQVIEQEFEKRPKRSEHNPEGLPERTVLEAKVVEFGPVTFPAYAQATAGLRSMTDEFIVGRLTDDPERLLELIRQAVYREPVVSVSFGDTTSTTASTATSTNLNEFSVVNFTGNTVPADEADERSIVEPEPSEAATPQTTAEPDPSEDTTRSQRGQFWFAKAPGTKKER